MATLTVSELIQKLRTCPPDAEVCVVGYDSTSYAVDVEYNDVINEVEIHGG